MECFANAGALKGTKSVVGPMVFILSIILIRVRCPLDSVCGLPTPDRTLVNYSFPTVTRVELGTKVRV